MYRKKKALNVLQTIMMPQHEVLGLCPVRAYDRYMGFVHKSGVEPVGKFWLQVDMKHKKFKKLRRGVNKLAAITIEIAHELALETPNKYTSHALRRTSATFLIESGVPRDLVKKHGVWTSDTAVEGYFDSSNLFRSSMGNAIACGRFDPRPQPSVKVDAATFEQKKDAKPEEKPNEDAKPGEAQ